MVSNAREDFPEPDSPVMTTSLSRGIETSTFFRLCSRAPRTRISRDGLLPAAGLWRLAFKISSMPNVHLRGGALGRAGSPVFEIYLPRLTSSWQQTRGVNIPRTRLFRQLATISRSG